MKERGLDIKELSVPIPRYVRAKPTHKVSTKQLADDLGVSVDNLVEIEGHYWALNPQLRINHCKLYQ